MDQETRIKKALAEAVAAIYFNDSSDYGTALWSVVHLLGGEEAATLLEEDEAEAYAQYVESLRNGT